MLEIKIDTGSQGDGRQTDFRDRGDELENAKQLEELAGILTKAEEIKADEVLYRAVQAHMNRKQKKYRSIADLRGAIAGKDKDNGHMAKDTGNEDEEGEDTREDEKKTTGVRNRK